MTRGRRWPVPARRKRKRARAGRKRKRARVGRMREIAMRRCSEPQSDAFPLAMRKVRKSDADQWPRKIASRPLIVIARPDSLAVRLSLP